MSHHTKRFNHTLQFLNSVITKDEQIVDLGVENQLSSLLKENGYKIENTKGEDLDLFQEL